MNGKVSNRLQIACVRRYTVTNGAESGLDIIDCDNGKLRFLINVSKACDIMQLFHEGQNISFISKNGFSKRETPFINRFEGGMVYTCGLDSIGGRDGYELHGSLHNIPAEIIRAELTDDEIVVEAEVKDSALFGKNLVLKRKISSKIGSESLLIEDKLINRGFCDEDYCVLYHVNIGYPMLDDDGQIFTDVKQSKPRTCWAEKNDSDKYITSNPIVGQEETCYFLKLNKPEISYFNKKLNKKFTLTYSQETLPNFVLWKSMACGDYALGIEPSTSELDENFAYKKIKAGEVISFNLQLKVQKTV